MEQKQDIDLTKVYLVQFMLFYCMFQLEFEPLLGKPIVCDPIFLLTEIKESPKISKN